MYRQGCKKHKISGLFVLTLLGIVISITSCENFNKPVREYFDYYTNTAGIEQVSVPESIGTWNGMHVIESNSDKEVYFYIRNPKHYLLNMNFAGNAGSPLSEGSADQFDEDRSLAKMHFDASTLYNYENDYPDNKVISGKFYINSADEVEREFPTFNFSLLVNTAPPPVKNPLLQLSAEQGGQYVLCFFAPVTGETVHKDTKKLYINNECFSFKTDGTVDNSNFSSSSGTLYPLASGGIKFSDFTLPSGYKACYYRTEVYPDDSEKKFTVTLEDNYGFKSTSSISNKAQKLNPPKLVAAADNSIVQNSSTYMADEDTKEFTFKIIHDGKYTTNETFSGSVKTYYTVTKNGSVIRSGSANGNATFKLKKGTYTITSYAAKPYCVDSDEINVTNIKINEPTVYYVASNGTKGSDDDDGSKDKPFRVFSKVFTAAGTSFESLKIYIKTDITDYFFEIDNDSCMVAVRNEISGKPIEISGYNGIKTINLSSMSGKSFLSIANSCRVTLKNLIITGANSTAGDPSVINNFGNLTIDNCSVKENTIRGIYSHNSDNAVLTLKGKVTITDNTKDGIPCNLYINGDSEEKISDVSGLLSSSRIGITTASTPETGTPVTFMTCWSLELGNPWNIFSSDLSDYFVDYLNDQDTAKVVLKKQSSQIIIDPDVNLGFTYSSSSGKALFTLTSGQTISLVPNSSTLTVSGGDVVPANIYNVSVSGGNQIQITTDSLQTGSYVLNTTIQYDGSTYNINLPFTKN